MKLILRHTGFIVLLTALGVVYIFNTHSAEGKLRDIATLKKEVADSKSKYQEVKSDINYKSTESQLAKELEKSGFKKLEKTPMVLEAKKS